MTGRIEIDLISTFDGVMQAPGGSEEDRSGGFTFGGWQAPLGDEAVGQQAAAFDAIPHYVASLAEPNLSWRDSHPTAHLFSATRRQVTFRPREP